MSNRSELLRGVDLDEAFLNHERQKRQITKEIIKKVHVKSFVTLEKKGKLYRLAIDHKIVGEQKYSPEEILNELEKAGVIELHFNDLENRG